MYQDLRNYLKIVQYLETTRKFRAKVTREFKLYFPFKMVHFQVLFTVLATVCTSFSTYVVHNLLSKGLSCCLPVLNEPYKKMLGLDLCVHSRLDEL